MKAFVTGATGFIGANVVRVLLERGFSVRVLVRRSSDRRNIEGLPIEVVEGDLRDFTSVKRGMAGCGVVFHVGALYSFWVRPRRLVYEVNVDGTRHVLRAAAESGVEAVVYTSSVAALGLGTRERPATEETPVDPRHIVSDYKRSKYLAQQVAIEFARRKGFPVYIVNPSYPVGPHDIKPTPTGQLILDFLRRKVPAYMDTGMNVVAVEDVALGHLLVLERGKPGEPYILGGDNLTMREFLGVLAELTGIPAPRVRIPYAVALPMAYLNAWYCRVFGGMPRMTPDTVRMARHYMFYDPRKAVEELGFPRTPAREALGRAVKWFRETGMAKGG
ncbi:MAG: NAD-dependent epimerase/dehydratase family protein [Caldiserica bacterium]|nr:NAD-dependent epimerase/dehydratase family protein [Caldisericota bacterium]